MSTNIDKNYKIFRDTISDLSRSQGSYGRLLANIQDIEQDKIALDALKNKLPIFKDSVDVILFIEQ